MKRSGNNDDEPQARKSGVKWDEENLEENEKIKKELNPRKIDEPKTPYSRSPMQTDDEMDSLADDPALSISPLSLNDAAADAAGPSGSAPPQGAGLRIHKSPWSDSSDHLGTTSNGNGNSPNNKSRNASRSPRFSVEYYKDDDSEDDEESVDAEALEKKRRFKEARKQHYHMQTAFKVSGDEEDEEEEEEDDASMGESTWSEDQQQLQRGRGGAMNRREQR